VKWLREWVGTENVSVSIMAWILLVEDDQHWLKLISEALPQHQVDMARSYDEAVERLREGLPYDVAIVDLNLIGKQHDMLGGDVLKLLRDDHPATRRIALTGSPPGAVRRILDRYRVDDLLLKQSMDLAEVRAVVEAAAERARGDVPQDVWARRSELWADFSEWRGDTTLLLDQQAQRLGDDLQRDLRSSGRTRAADGAASRAALAALRAELARLEAQKGTFARRCANVSAMIAGIADAGGLAAASREIDHLKMELNTGTMGD
jgi:CheY-like chemotaxis protein